MQGIDKKNRIAASQLQHSGAFEQLILASCVKREITTPCEELRTLATSIDDWRSFFDLCDEHKVHQIVVHNLVELGLHSMIPKPIWNQAIAQFRIQASQNLRNFGYLLHAQQVLKDHGIEFLAFKGPVQAVEDYGDLSLRSFSDLDIYVRKSSIAESAHALASIGFEAEDKSTLNPKALAEHLECSHELRVFHSESGNLIELHWALAPSYWSLRISANELFEGANRPERLGGQIPIMKPEHRIVVILVQAAKAQWLQIGRIAGAAQFLVSHPNLDWQLAATFARDSGLSRILRIGLLMVDRLFAIGSPSNLWTTKENELAQQMSNEFCDRLLSPRPEQPFDWTGTYLRSRERFRDRFPFFIHRANEVLTTNKSSIPLGDNHGVDRMKSALKAYGLFKPILYLLGRR